MHTLEALGAGMVGAGFAGAAITGFVQYLATHGVPPTPNPAPPGSARDTPERRAFFDRYNARYVAVVRVACRTLLAAGIVGIVLLIIGAVE
ncbi:hypothetical protein [uncultured Jatrophihabitans sp.]|uniref:hypothetical protein n=1 Tax=uncultured Jatrophihabitans sp. TaxID=1610747 RepID=UPI0035CC22E5